MSFSVTALTLAPNICRDVGEAEELKLDDVGFEATLTMSTADETAAAAPPAETLNAVTSAAPVAAAVTLATGTSAAVDVAAVTPTAPSKASKIPRSCNSSALTIEANKAVYTKLLNFIFNPM